MEKNVNKAGITNVHIATNTIYRDYQGDELELFAKATNWKKYFATFIIPYLKGRVLEVGAGQGETTKIFLDKIKKCDWICLEPDKILFERLIDLKYRYPLFSRIKLTNDTIRNLSDERFDTILYIDVIEHISYSKDELISAADLLNENGHLIILSPAFKFLYSPFDKRVGHITRYSKKTLKKIIPDKLHTQKVMYLDSVGLLASLTNKLILKQSMPTENQILFWDNTMVKLSNLFDRLFFYSLGKSILGIWQKRTMCKK